MNAILHIATTGREGAMLPKDLPPHSIVQRHVHGWRAGGLPHTIRFDLALRARDLEIREARRRQA